MAGGDRTATAARVADTLLQVVGAGRDSAEAYAPAFVRWAAAPSRWTACRASCHPGGPRVPAGRGSRRRTDLAAAARAVEAAAGRADLVLVAVHWGIEGSFCPVDHQRELAARLVTAGADVVAGHHPHVLQGVERRGDALAAYSLGNFVWYHSRSPSDRTGVWSVTLDGRGVVDWRFTPAVIGSTGGPVPVDGALARAIRDEVLQRSPSGGTC